jgi:hypothetical protein
MYNSLLKSLTHFLYLKRGSKTNSSLKENIEKKPTTNTIGWNYHREGRRVLTEYLQIRDDSKENITVIKWNRERNMSMVLRSCVILG